MADGVLPSNEGRGYVLRRIMRRAMRHAHLLGTSEPLMHRLVPSLVTEMGQAFPELQRGQSLIEEVLLREEAQFRKTLDKGLKLLDDATGAMHEGENLDGETAFRLYDTFGFPYDLTEDALRARGIGVDREGFDAAMARQKAAARAAWKGSGDAASSEVWFDIAERAGATEFTGYSSTSGEGCVVAIVQGGAEVQRVSAGESAVILTNQSPFYGESGGQSGDSGTISTPGGFAARVSDTGKPLGRLHAHQVEVTAGTVAVGDNVQMVVNADRRAAIRANHSATHLVHAALRNRLGDHVTQKGSLVAEDRLRFDFSHPSALTPEDIAAIEAEVNAEIRANETVSTRLMSPDEAIEAGALALFGEKYGEEVRVLSMGRAAGSGRTYSVELCGGTHVRATGDIGVFRIVSESAVSSGVRRIEALTGEAARQWLVAREDALKAAAATIRTTPEEVPTRVAVLMEDRKRLEKDLAEARKALALAGSGTTKDTAPADEKVGGVTFSGQVIDGLSPKDLRPLLDEAKSRLGSGIAVIVAVNEGKAAIAAAVTDDLTDRFSAVDLVRLGVEALGGKGGGGRPDMAQGGGPDAENASGALAAVRARIGA
jgi:alanyl-tRNA synthetase